jgi:RNA polymerase subunit RPABC4/transcription elongation factor Spt4
MGSGGPAASAPSAIAHPAPLLLHQASALAPRPQTMLGDLIVTPANSPYLIGSPQQLGRFILQGNLTVLAGGTLILLHENLVQQEFVSDGGTTAQRLAHVYTMSDQGTIVLNNSVISSNFQAFNPFAKIDLNISSGGHLIANHSELAFPGWITVYGAGSTLNLTNGSAIVPGTPGPGAYPENQTLANDTSYAPSLRAAAGAHVNLFDSSYNGTYAENYSAYGFPGPANPIVDVATHTLTGAVSGTWATFIPAVPDAENLTRAILYQSITAGNLTISYSAANSLTSATSHVDFGGALPLGPINFASGGGNVVVPLPAAVITGINAGGFRQFLIGLDADGADVVLSALNASGSVTVNRISLNVTDTLDYNLTVTGPGTILTAVDSRIALNYAPTPGSYVPSSAAAPYPWYSNKLLLEDGAVGYFASLTIPSNITNNFWNQSAILPDSSSSAIFYRWFQVTVNGAGSASAPGAQVTAFYGLNNNQADNATVTALNILSTANPAIAQYVQQYDARQGVSGYGISDNQGVATLLLASSVLTQATLPDGAFLGGYHVAISIPGLTNGTQWITGSVSPYPQHMNPATADANVGNVVFISYAPQLSVLSNSVLVDQSVVANDTVAIGQNLTIQVTLVNSGIGPINTVDVALLYAEKAPLAPHLLVTLPTSGALATGAQLTVNLTWRVAENVTGRNGTFTENFLVTGSWNGGGAPSGGTVEDVVAVKIVPAFIRLTYTPPSVPLVLSSELATSGTIAFIGRGNATINVTAVNLLHRYFLGATLSQSGTYTVFLQPPADMVPGHYDLNVTATYNHRTVNLTLINAVTLSGSTSSTSTPWYEQSFLGLPLWIWIVIAAGIAVGIFLFLWFLRSQSKGKLVECGECGELIPENATVCPKCGAEFESDLVRCSRCSSTIPANSAQCPECAAQLLGPETSDPERQGYQDFVEKFRVEARKELGDNYGEGAFWDWFKRQTSYVSFNQWKLQQSQGDRTGMAAPPAAGPAPVDSTNQFQPGPPKGGAGGAMGADPGAGRSSTPSPPSASPPSASAALPTRPVPAAAPPATSPPSGGAGPAMKACGNCGKEIPPDYLVCPFCGAVTR